MPRRGVVLNADPGSFWMPTRGVAINAEGGHYQCRFPIDAANTATRPRNSADAFAEDLTDRLTRNSGSPIVRSRECTVRVFLTH